MQLTIYIAIAVAAFLLMEAVAWLAHKYLMHGWLWRLHEDHHHKEEYGFWEHNDFFFLIFATPGMVLLAVGIFAHSGYALYAGVGISFYGLCYFLVHDLFIHQRLKLLRNSNNRYLKGIRRAHKMHHKNLGKNGGECFGMLWVPLKYFKQS